VALSDIPPELHRLYEIHEWRHASAVLLKDFPAEWRDVLDVLLSFRLLKSRVVVPGGSKSFIAGTIDGALLGRGWIEKQFKTAITVDERTEQSPTHKVDCFKGKVGLEIEWNNKDPFFDRDLNNFRLLFDLRALSVGVIVTRCDELQTIFNRLAKGSSYGNSTTHMSKLLPRLNGGGGGGCPVLVFGIRDSLFVEDIPDGETAALVDEFRIARKSKWTELGPTLIRYFDPAELRKTPITGDDN
jgi:Restriction endonuclease BglII